MIITENKLEVSQLYFNKKEHELISFENQPTTSQGISIPIEKHTTFINKTKSLERKNAITFCQKTNIKSELQKSANDKPKDTEPKKEKKLEAFSIVSLAMSLLSIIVYLLEGAILVYPILAFAFMAAIISLFRFKQNKNKYFGRGFAIAGTIIALLALGLILIYPDALEFKLITDLIFIDE